MATLAESFLKDLEDLDLEDENENENEESEKNGAVQNSSKRFKPNDTYNGTKKEKTFTRVGTKQEDSDDEKNSDYDEIVDAIEEFMNEKKKSRSHSISELIYDDEFLKFMGQINEYVDILDEERDYEERKARDENNDNKIDDEIAVIKKRKRELDMLEEEEGKKQAKGESSIVEKCIELILKIDHEILNIHKYVKDIYSTKFPELYSIVCNPLEYICVVMKIKNETDLTVIDFTDILPNTTIMAVTVASSMTAGIRLPDKLLNNCLSVCEEGMQLNEFRKTILIYLESKMFSLAPNLTTLLGSALTARLISFVGSLQNAAFMSSQNLMVVGYSKKSNLGMSNANKTYGIGILYLSDIVQNVNDSYKAKAVKLLASKCGLAARIDYFKKYKDGQYGIMLRESVIQHLIKLQEYLPLKQKKVLPIPDEKLKRKRGGKRYRKLKERTQITELRKQMSRVPFGPNTTDDHYADGYDEITNLFNSNTAKVKYQAKQKLTVPKKKSITVQSSGATGGISSSLIFTPIRGIELHNPSSIGDKQNKIKKMEENAHNKYFSLTSEFRKL